MTEQDKTEEYRDFIKDYKIIYGELCQALHDQTNPKLEEIRDGFDEVKVEISDKLRDYAVEMDLLDSWSRFAYRGDDGLVVEFNPAESMDVEINGNCVLLELSYRQWPETEEGFRLEKEFWEVMKPKLTEIISSYGFDKWVWGSIF